MRRLDVPPPHLYAANCKFYVYGSARLARVFERPSGIAARLLTREKRTETHGPRGRLLAANAASFATRKKKNPRDVRFRVCQQDSRHEKKKQTKKKPKLTQIVVNPFTKVIVYFVLGVFFLN